MISVLLRTLNWFFIPKNFIPKTYTPIPYISARERENALSSTNLSPNKDFRQNSMNSYLISDFTEKKKVELIN